jgi:hypothetical protein
VYGLVKPLGSFDPLRAQVHHFVDIARRARALSGWDRLRVVLRGPEWGYPAAPEVTRAAQRKHAVELTSREVRGLATALVIAVVTTFLLLWYQYSLPLWERAALAAFVLALMAAWGLLLDRRLIFSKSRSAATEAPGPV